VDEIASIKDVDVLFVGPSDLKMNISACSDETPIEYNEALRLVSNATGKYHKSAGILVRNTTDLPHLKQLGFSCFAMGSDLGILKNGFRRAYNVCAKN